MQSLSDYLLLLTYSLGLKQLLFDYKKTQWLRDRLSTLPILNELNHCVYCQSIEVSLIVYVVLSRFSVDSVLAVLANGFVGLAIDGLIRDAIMKTEQSRDFTVNSHENESKDESETQS